MCRSVLTTLRCCIVAKVAFNSVIQCLAIVSFALLAALADTVEKATTSVYRMLEESLNKFLPQYPESDEDKNDSQQLELSDNESYSGEGYSGEGTCYSGEGYSGEGTCSL